MKRVWPHRLLLRILLWLAGVPAVLILALYIVLWITPIPTPFIRDQAQSGAIDALPPNIAIEFGQTELALERGLYPVIRFTPVKLTDSDSGANIDMDALHVGFSPLRALFGQPGISVTMVRPHIQVIQDLFGPRLAGFELVDDEDGDDATIWILEGEKSLPSVRISSEGLAVGEALSADSGVGFRSDNDWLIYNLLATESGLAAFEEQANRGTFSRLRVRDGVLDMHDSVYGLLRQFTGVQLDLVPTALGGNVRGRFAATLAGRDVEGEVLRSRTEDGGVNLAANITNIDYATLLPFIDDPDGLLAVRGAGTLGLSVDVAPDGLTVQQAEFDVDMTGTSLRVQDDLFPVRTENVHIVWDPAMAKFTVDSAYIEIGQSSATLSGVIVMGLDDTFGPTLSLSMSGKDVYLHPNDMDAPAEPFEEIAVSGWSAPLYGALGIDQAVARKPGVLVRTRGRADMLRSGIGLDLEVGGSGASADDMKRLWPYFLSPEARDWFVENVKAGRVEDASMRFDFPLGTIAMKGEDKPIPPGAMSIDITGSEVVLTPMEGVDPISIDGPTRVAVRDAKTTISLDGATLDAGSGPVKVDDVAFIIDTKPADRFIYEVSGQVEGGIPALLAVIESNAPGAIGNADLPLDPARLSGDVSGSLVATIVMQDTGELANLDYAANGTVSDFDSGQPIEGFSVEKGDLAFSVTPAGYGITGNAQVSGVEVGLNVGGELQGEPELKISAELDVEQIKEFGFDATEFIGGKIRFEAQPLPEGVIKIAADLDDASLNVADLGISKAAGVEGGLEAEVKQIGDKVEVNAIQLGFAGVDLRGSLTADLENGLESADFPTFKLSAGDEASLNVSPRDDGGVNLRLRGEQLDLKPMLRRFFALDEASTGGPQSTQFDEAINLDVELSRAIGFYQTTAYNLDLELLLVGADLRRVSMQAQFAEGSSVSIATNPVQGGRSMSVAVNDAGTLLRFLNVYPRLLGGQGSLTLTHSNAEGTQRGVLRLRNFSLVDEEKVVEVLGNHRDSRELIASQNRLNFNDGRVEFIRRWDRIEVVDAVLDGDTTGGTMRGYIYTQAREYDLTGTYIPLFALNNIFQKLPIIGDILGGREGEGLVGVTFAVRGSLDNPQFLINPASILLPGAFRSLMEFRANEKPR